MKKLTLVIALFFCFTAHAAEKVYTQDFVATIVSIYDGDTITVDIDGLPEVFSKAIGIRVYGVDTPEIKGPHKAEAIKARDFVRGICPIGSKVKLTNIRRDKYFRLDADVVCSGKSVGEELLKLGMGKAYFGGTSE